MLKHDIFETLLKIANRYDLELKYPYYESYFNHFLIEEKKTEFKTPFVEISRNGLYVDAKPNWVSIEIYVDNKTLCYINIYNKDIPVILKKMEQYLEDCDNYYDFLKNFAIFLRQKY